MADDFAGIPPPGSVPDPTPPQPAPDPAPTVASTGRTQDLSPDAEGPAEPAHRESPGMGPETGDPAQYQKILDYFSGKGAMPPEQFEGLKGQASRPDEQLSPTELNMRILDMAAQAGPEAALGAVQSMRSQYEPRRAQAARAAEAGHMDVAAKEATDAMGHIPDDHEVTFAPGRGGVVAVVNSPTGDTHKFDFPGQEFASALKSPQTIWDHMVDNGAQKVLEQLAVPDPAAAHGGKHFEPSPSPTVASTGGKTEGTFKPATPSDAAPEGSVPEAGKGESAFDTSAREETRPPGGGGTPTAGAPATTGTAAAPRYEELLDKPATPVFSNKGVAGEGTRTSDELTQRAAARTHPAGPDTLTYGGQRPNTSVQYGGGKPIAFGERSENVTPQGPVWEKRYDTQADKWGNYNTRTHQWQPQETEAAADARSAMLNKAAAAGQTRPEQKVIAVHAGGSTKYYMVNNTINGIPMGTYEVSPQEARTMHETGAGTKNIQTSGGGKDGGDKSISEQTTHYGNKREDVIPTMSRDSTPDPNASMHGGHGGAGAATEEAKAVRQTQHDIYSALIKQTEPLTPRQQDFIRQYEQSGQASFKQPLQPPGPMTGLKPGSGRKFPDGSVWTLDPNGKPYRYQ